MINFIAIASTAISVAFVVSWILWPTFRKSAEKPKYTVLKNVRRFREQSSNVKAGEGSGQNR